MRSHWLRKSFLCGIMVAFDVNLVEVLSYTVFGKREGKKDGLVRNEYEGWRGSSSPSLVS